jgi:hypothetical protein
MAGSEQQPPATPEPLTLTLTSPELEKKVEMG